MTRFTAPSAPAAARRSSRATIDACETVAHVLEGIALKGRV
jgi:hypothetical protein